jgi:hypothetical protein
MTRRATGALALALLVLLAPAACGGADPVPAASAPPTPTATPFPTPDPAAARPDAPYDRPPGFACDRLPYARLVPTFGTRHGGTSPMEVKHLQVLGVPTDRNTGNSYTCRILFGELAEGWALNLATSVAYMASGEAATALTNLLIRGLNDPSSDWHDARLLPGLGDYAVLYAEPVPTDGRIGASYRLIVLAGNVRLNIGAVRVTGRDEPPAGAALDDRGRAALVAYARAALDRLT